MTGLRFEPGLLALAGRLEPVGNRERIQPTQAAARNAAAPSPIWIASRSFMRSSTEVTAVTLVALRRHAPTLPAWICTWAPVVG